MLSTASASVLFCGAYWGFLHRGAIGQLECSVSLDVHGWCRPLWNLHRCLLTLEYATFACPANEQALVHIRPAAPLQPSIRPVHEQTSAPGRQ